MKFTSFVNKLLCCFILFVSLSSFSNPIKVDNPFWEGEIHLSDGTVKKGYVEVIKHEKQAKVSFKSTLKASEEKIDRKTIETVYLVSPNGKKYIYEKAAPTNTLTGSKTYGSSMLALVMGRNSFATLYVTSENYVVDSKTNEIILYYKYNAATDFMLTRYYVKKKGDSYAGLIYGTGHLGGVKKGVESRLSDAPKIVKRVKDGEFDSNDLPKILELYLEETEGK